MILFGANGTDCPTAGGILQFSLLFNGITAIYEKGHNSDYAAEDRNCVDLLGFAYDDESLDGVSSHIGGEGLNSFIFVFVTEGAIKITASEVSFQLET